MTISVINAETKVTTTFNCQGMVRGPTLTL
jgi:hypothetical protein